MTPDMEITNWRKADRYERRLGQQAVYVCPGCGREVAVGPLYTIAADGTVRASAMCPLKGCSFHRFITLVGWGEEKGRDWTGPSGEWR